MIVATTDEEEYNNGDEYDDTDNKGIMRIGDEDGGVYDYNNYMKIMRIGDDDDDDDDEDRECSHWVEDCRPGQPLKVGRQSGREEQSLPRMQ